MKKNILFVCTVNKLRSRTAETLFKDSSRFLVKSAGTDKTATVLITSELIEWAEVIFVMEKHHKRTLEKRFKSSLKGKRIIILEIPDDYEYMAPELVQIFKDNLPNYFD